MTKSRTLHSMVQPMRVQARQGSLAEKRLYAKSALPGGAWPMPRAVRSGIDPSPLDDLIYHGGRVVPEMRFQNIYLGTAGAWTQSDMASIDGAICLAMRDRRLNKVMAQYFPGAVLTCDPRVSLVVKVDQAHELDERDVQATIIALYDHCEDLDKSDLDATIFNLLLPPGATLRLDASSSLEGLGGYHGSVRIQRRGKSLTLYYSASVYSQMLSPTRENGIVAFDSPWKNVVGTLYHELNEFRTNPDVSDAIQTGNNDLLGWMSRRGAECGDQPIFAARSRDLVFQEVVAAPGTRRIPVQLMYSNAAHGAELPVTAGHASPAGDVGHRETSVSGRIDWGVVRHMSFGR